MTDKHFGIYLLCLLLLAAAGYLTGMSKGAWVALGVIAWISIGIHAYLKAKHEPDPGPIEQYQPQPQLAPPPPQKPPKTVLVWVSVEECDCGQCQALRKNQEEALEEHGKQALSDEAIRSIHRREQWGAQYDLG